MHKLLAGLAVSFAVTAVTPPSAGQTLDERIAAIRRQQQQEAARTRLTILQTLLYKDLTVSFDRTPARDAFEFMRTALDVNMIVRYSDEAVGYGIDPELPITLSVEGMPALEVLELVLEQASVVDPCTWQLRKGFLEVGTKERLSVEAAREIRWFPVDELTFQAPRFDDAFSLRLDRTQPLMPGLYGYGGGLYGYGGAAYGGGVGGSIQFSRSAPARSASQPPQGVESLMDLIRDVIEPTAWTHNGGDFATMHYRDGHLIVVAPEFIQRQIFGYPKIPPPERATPAERAPAPGGTAPRPPR